MPFPILPKTPIHHLSLSSAGLIALADLQTLSRRTALTGTSSWLDALVLAPGLHYHQAAEEAISGDYSTSSAVTSRAFGSGNDDSGGQNGVFAAETLPTGESRPVRVTNPGMLLLLSRIKLQEEKKRSREMRQTTLQKRRRSGGGGIEALDAADKIHDDEHKVIFLDVGTLPSGRRKRTGRAFASASGEGDWEFERASNMLYLASPLLTASAVTVMVLLGDWWGLAAIAALMTSRLLNIYIIKSRTPPQPHPSPSPSSAPSLTEYTVPLSPLLTIHIRGSVPDLSALTSSQKLLPLTETQNYLEAAAKLTIYVVAALGGNVSQSGNAVLLVLLLGSAALLGLSNGSMKGVRGQGRVARVWDGPVGT
ncbi:hypothetical protein CPLU01_14157 [Colletotrichum plurivorum]|uniref:Uncharacterized protein n=1 Tax=Colletotrichum plurivorum TaxID=2175906 RepID=A0A8H6N043_9PEZI|nr:hypothetical protein CPLU01_14157 [Colletotrichum plurivorum]